MTIKVSFLFEMALLTGFILAFGFLNGSLFFLLANFIGQRITETFY
ncbi:hypothetical protein [Arthronema virus TR020]|uniref:Uncharacterized protein n=1 Tax=Arthronema virus TR020 TaxID=2736280 RepID=A0A7G3WH20_9CAUD|nr:hypothetical protein [Arthronema virus TR020]